MGELSTEKHSKLAVKSSHLALRFYKSSGWTEAALRDCLKKGDLKFYNDMFYSFGDMSYWVVTVGSVFDVDRLLSVAGGIYDFNNRLLTDRQEAAEYITGMSW